MWRLATVARFPGVPQCGATDVTSQGACLVKRDFLALRLSSPLLLFSTLLGEPAGMHLGGLLGFRSRCLSGWRGFRRRPRALGGLSPGYLGRPWRFLVWFTARWPRSLLLLSQLDMMRILAEFFLPDAAVVNCRRSVRRTYARRSRCPRRFFRIDLAGPLVPVSANSTSPSLQSSPGLAGMNPVASEGRNSEVGDSDSRRRFGLCGSSSSDSSEDL